LLLFFKKEALLLCLPRVISPDITLVMVAIVIRNLPDDVHAALRRIAQDRHQSVEAVAREALTRLTGRVEGGIDFAQLAFDRKVLGL
jgi:plasmid stability protein